MVLGTDALNLTLMVAGPVAWAALALLVRWVLRASPREPDDVAAGATIRFLQIYARLMHKLQIQGAEHIRGRTIEHPSRDGRPLIIVANHTAGVDPVLIQAALPFEVRWMMAQDMRTESLQWIWDFCSTIFVDRQVEEGKRGDTRGLREAIRHLKSGGVLGIFPEGNIERPPKEILPFREGVGMLISRSGAEVLPVVIEGTPTVDPAWASLWFRSHATLRFLEPILFERTGRSRSGGTSPSDVAAQLRSVFLKATGWPANDHTPTYKDGQWWYVDDEGAWKPVSAITQSGSDQPDAVATRR